MLTWASQFHNIMLNLITPTHQVLMCKLDPMVATQGLFDTMEFVESLVPVQRLALNQEANGSQANYIWRGSGCHCVLAGSSKSTRQDFAPLSIR